MTEEHNPNLELDGTPVAAPATASSQLDFPAATDDMNSEASLIDQAALLQTVEVQTKPLAERQRQISAQISIPHPVEHVWQVLTDYEALADFIPNLAKSRLLEHPTGGIRLEQVGTQKLLRFNFSARVILDLEEKFPHEIHFSLVEGDLKDYSGSWRLEPDLSQEHLTNLRYTVRVWPKRATPVAIIERRLCSDLRLNLLAIRQRIDDLFC